MTPSTEAPPYAVPGAPGCCAEARRAFAAMMDMKKIDVAKIEAARRG